MRHISLSSRLRRFSGALLLSVTVLGAGVVGATASPSLAEAAVPEINKVAVVDLQRVLNETNAGKKARTELETSSTAKQKKLDKRRVKLEEEQTKLGKLQGDALMAAQEKLQRDYYELQSMYMTLQQELAEQEARTLETMYGNCQKLAKTLAKDFSLDLVLVRDQSTILFVGKGLDMTDEIIKRYNKTYK